MLGTKSAPVTLAAASHYASLPFCGYGHGALFSFLAGAKQSVVADPDRAGTLYACWHPLGVAGA